MPSQLAALPSLQRLVLASNQLSGTLPAPPIMPTAPAPTEGAPGEGYREGGAMRSPWAAATHLLLSDNRLSGTLAPALGGLRHLRALQMSHSCISGTLPTQLAPQLASSSLLRAVNASNGLLPSATESAAGSGHALESVHLSSTLLSGSRAPTQGPEPARSYTRRPRAHAHSVCVPLS